MKTTKDLFSDQTNPYAQYRPHYPEALYSYLFGQVPAFDTAWDCGTGNGQVAVRLAEHFANVIATDISEKQLAEAFHRPNIHYQKARAEDSGLPEKYANLITAAQAVHWFDHDLFFKEVRRVGRPGGIVAIWGYGLPKISPHADPLLHDFDHGILGPYWEPERRHIDDGYRNIPFPFEEIPAPFFFINLNWKLEELEGFLQTWSAVHAAIRQTGKNPVNDLVKKLEPHWGKGERKELRFPVFLRVGRL